MPELPFGRGYRVGKDAHVNQNESWDARARAMYKRDAWMISPFRAYGSDQTSATGYGQALRIVLLPVLDSVLEADYARLRVTTSNSGSFVKACIYRLDTKNDTKRFVKVPSTDVSFHGDSTGVKVVKLSNTATLSPEARYFLGAWVSNASIGISSGVNTSQRVIPVKTITMPIASAGVALPSQMGLSSMYNSYGSYVPWITYTSSMAQDILS